MIDMYLCILVHYIIYIICVPIEFSSRELDSRTAYKGKWVFVNFLVPNDYKTLFDLFSVNRKTTLLLTD